MALLLFGQDPDSREPVTAGAGAAKAGRASAMVERMATVFIVIWMAESRWRMGLEFGTSLR